MKYPKKLINSPPKSKSSHPKTHHTVNGIDHKIKNHNINPMDNEIARLYNDFENDSKNL